MRKKKLVIGSSICIKGYESLPFEIVDLRTSKRPVGLRHPLTDDLMWFAFSELTEIE